VHVEVRTWNPKTRYACTTRYTYNSDGTPPTMSQSSRTVTADAIFGTNGSISNAVSYNPQTGTYSGSSTSSASSGGGFSSSVSGIPRETSGERIIIRKPNLTKDQCADLALKTLAQITRNEITVTFVVIPTPTTFANLTIESAFSLSDMPYARWNSTPTIPFFYPKRITTTFDGPSESTSAGLRMQFECYNHLPYSNEI
jgi:hypothetical protein